jgi:GNAT superfamily N-acetyltransferase
MQLVQQHIDGEYTFSTDKKLLDISYIHHYLSEHSYWAKGIPREFVVRSIENSICIGIYSNNSQMGFARVVTDLATFGYLADVFIDEKFRGLGLSKKLMTFIVGFNELKSLRRIILATRDAHGLYTQFGFSPLKSPDRFMEIARPEIYQHVSTKHD